MSKLSTKAIGASIAQAVNELPSTKTKIKPDDVLVITAGADWVYFSIDKSPFQYQAVHKFNEKGSPYIVSGTISLKTKSSK